jgi:hypothetical protein
VIIQLTILGPGKHLEKNFSLFLVHVLDKAVWTYLDHLRLKRVRLDYGRGEDRAGHAHDWLAAEDEAATLRRLHGLAGHAAHHVLESILTISFGRSVFRYNFSIGEFWTYLTPNIRYNFYGQLKHNSCI